ncbi:MAG TPA: GvpL/GvpF family gas vesicle protein [Gemmatimonadaceae bacterium]|nr:GvpL/GvpF family gas vesicle protein [Gemmatimonadaceae bacterium]
MAITGLTLYGVALLGGASTNGIGAGVNAIAFRDLGAIVRPVPYLPMDPADGALEDYHRVVDSVFRRFTLIPAPFGAIFRSPEQVRVWLEMNYIALSEGMHFLEGRCETRVHIRETSPEGASADLTAIAAEVFRALRRQAVAAVPLRRGDGDEVMGCAFLIQRVSWAEFSATVQEQARRYDELQFEQTGPWPPYDFVRMELGA